MVRTVADVISHRLLGQLDSLAHWNRYLSLHLSEGAHRDAPEPLRSGADERGLRRTQQALARWTEAVIDQGLDLALEARPRAVLAHRDAATRKEMCRRLHQHGVFVLAETDDAPEALAVAIVEQPDVVLLDNRLPSMPTAQLVRHLRAFVPGAFLGVQVGGKDEGIELLGAGATAVASRRVPCAALVDNLEWAVAYARSRGQAVRRSTVNTARIPAVVG